MKGELKGFISREDLVSLYSNYPWIAPYGEIIAFADEKNGIVQVAEKHPPFRGYLSPGWTPHELNKNYSIKAKREGNWQTYITKIGKMDSTYGRTDIKEIKVTEDGVEIVYTGVAGASTSIVSRGMAEGSKGIEFIKGEFGGSKKLDAKLILEKYEKINFGIDDTDTPEEGATWCLANNIVQNLTNVKYLGHTNTQLWEKCPYKTKNCVSTGILLATKSKFQDKVIKDIVEQVTQKTLSDETSISINSGIIIPPEIKKFSLQSKVYHMKIKEAEKIAKNTDTELIEITGKKGKVGALAALGFIEEPEAAILHSYELNAKLLDQFWEDRISFEYYFFYPNLVFKLEDLLKEINEVNQGKAINLSGTLVPNLLINKINAKILDGSYQGYRDPGKVIWYKLIDDPKADIISGTSYSDAINTVKTHIKESGNPEVFYGLVDEFSATHHNYLKKSLKNLKESLKKHGLSLIHVKEHEHFGKIYAIVGSRCKK